MFNKVDRLTSILLTCIITSKVLAEDVSDDDEYKVPECQYEYKEGIPQCPNVTTGGSIPKLMQCAAKLKHDLMGICKKPANKQLVERVLDECLESCILPCLPIDKIFTDTKNLVGHCDLDLSNLSSFEINMNTICDKKMQDIAKVCIGSMFRNHKSEYMDVFYKKIHIVYKLCDNVYNCYMRIKKELGLK